ncbi:MAG: NAD(P)H-binding protein, partial [Thermoproteota archaeon]|nr:NAD(P)H-binding protein [Thermoproteota archaeon]
MVETILITGATGTVGSEVVKQLSSNTTDINIKAAVHSIENAKKVQYDKVEVVQIDYNKPETLK